MKMSHNCYSAPVKNIIPIRTPLFRTVEGFEPTPAWGNQPGTVRKTRASLSSGPADFLGKALGLSTGLERDKARVLGVLEI